MRFKLNSDFSPSGDQPQAIDALVKGIESDKHHQVLLGVTGSGKTFTMANVIATLNRPTLILAHNKTLAAQLCSEFKAFFPENAVEYFVSYYQPEAMCHRVMFTSEKAQVNEEIERLSTVPRALYCSAGCDYCGIGVLHLWIGTLKR